MTGLWESQNKRGMFTGNLKTEQIEQLQDLCKECLDGTGKMVIFMFENDGQGKRSDPQFTIYGDVGKDQERGGGRGGRGGGRGQDEGRNGRDDRRDNRDNDRGRGRDDIQDDRGGDRNSDTRF